MKRALVVLALATLGAAAHADGLTANVSLTSKYKFRGQDQSDATDAVRPAIQGGFDYALGGLYVGTWASSIGFATGTEVDVYGGYKGDLGSGLGYDVGYLRYQYPGGKVGNTNEIYGALSFAFATLKYSHTVSGDYFGIAESENTGYLDLSANYELVKGLTINAHVGYTNFTKDAKNAAGVPDYTDYKVGATYDFGSGLSLSGAMVGANKKDFYGDANKSRLIITLTKAM